MTEERGRRPRAAPATWPFPPPGAYADESFDTVVTQFGAMFAPRPERAAAELVRVCRRGGEVAMANWTPRAFIGQMFRLNATQVPPPPGAAPPILWGDESKVREQLNTPVLKARPVSTPDGRSGDRKFLGRLIR